MNRALRDYLRYIKDNPEGYWFKRKLYGWGWTPVRWQGWFVLLGYIAAIVFLSLTLDDDSPTREVAFLFVLPVVFLTIALIRVCYRKGEPPRWQRGVPGKDSKE